MIVIFAAIGATAMFVGTAGDDALVHSAKVLYLRDVAFSLQDPYSPLGVIDSRYHFSVYHAIFAIGSWISGEEPLELWLNSAWFFRLMALGGIEFLAITIFHSRWIGVIAMLGAVGFIVSNRLITDPNPVTALVVFPVLFSHVLEVIDKPKPMWLGYLRILLGNLALAVIHVGFWLIVAMCVLPSILGIAIWRNLRGGLWLTGVLTIAMLLPGIPFLAITVVQPSYATDLYGAQTDWMLWSIKIGESLTLYMLNPKNFFWMMPAAAMLTLLLTLRSSLRSRMIICGSIFFTAVQYMFNFFILTPLMNWMPYWIAMRAFYVAQAIALVVFVPGMAWLSRYTLHGRMARTAFALTIVCASFTTFQTQIVQFLRARAPNELKLRQAHELSELFSSLPHKRSLVLADPETSLLLPAVRIAAVMAPVLLHANPADPAVRRRYEAATEFLAQGTTTQRRKEIVSDYRIEFAVIGSISESKGNLSAQDEAPLRGIADLVNEKHGFKLFRIRL
jgi:hypothetical protein